MVKSPSFNFYTLRMLSISVKCPLIVNLVPCMANIFAEYNQQDATFHNLFISVERSTCFRRVSRPSSGAQNCTYSIRYLSDQYLTLYVQFWAPDDGRKYRLKHMQRLTEINRETFRLVSCTLRSEVSFLQQRL